MEFVDTVGDDIMDDSTLIDKEYLISNINTKIQSAEIKVADLQDKISNSRIVIEYELGLVAAYKDAKAMLGE